jgi:hypothetical protein
MKKIIETLHRIHHALRGRDVVARFDTGAELIVYNRFPADAMVVDCSGRQYRLGDYISYILDQYPAD